MLCALALLADYARRREWMSLVAGMTALSLSMQSRPELLMLPALAWLMLPALRTGTVLRTWLSWQTFVGALWLVVLTLPRLLSLTDYGTGDTLVEGAISARIVVTQAIFDPAMTPLVWWGLGAVGLATALRTSPALAAFVVVTMLLLGAAPLVFFDMPIFRARAGLVQLPFFALIVGGALPALLAAAGPRGLGKLAAAAACAAVAATGFVSGLGYVRADADQQEEWRFLKEAIPRMTFGAGARLLTLTRNAGHRYLGAFPWFLLRRHDKDVTLVDLRDALEGEALPAPQGSLYFYQGTYCLFANDDEPRPAPYNVRCAAVHRRYRMTPVLVKTLKSPPYMHTRYTEYAGDQPLIGFFRIDGDAHPSERGARAR